MNEAMNEAPCAYCDSVAVRTATSCYTRHEPPREYMDSPALPPGQVVAVAVLPVCAAHFDKATAALCDAYGMASNFDLPVPLPFHERKES